jgi:hypothetical protein
MAHPDYPAELLGHFDAVACKWSCATITQQGFPSRPIRWSNTQSKPSLQRSTEVPRMPLCSRDIWLNSTNQNIIKERQGTLNTSKRMRYGGILNATLVVVNQSLQLYGNVQLYSIQHIHNIPGCFSGLQTRKEACIDRCGNLWVAAAAALAVHNCPNLIVLQ